MATFICPLAPGSACVRVSYGEAFLEVELLEMGFESMSVLSVLKPLWVTCGMSLGQSSWWKRQQICPSVNAMALGFQL